MVTDKLNHLRFYIAQLVRIWTALSLVRKVRSPELIRVFQDLCSDKLRIMLHELANKRGWTLGFEPNGNLKYDHLFARLCEANKWFEGYRNDLHYRNCSGAHLQPLDRAEHMFQQFGYGGEREWKHLTKGVASCVAMMKLIDGKPYIEFWRKIRAKVRDAHDEAISVTLGSKQMMVDLPIGVEALLQSFKAED